MTRLRPLVAVLVVGLCLSATACGADNKLPEAVAAVLDKATEIEFLSLSPNRGEKDIPAASNFHGFKILGKTTLKGVIRGTIVGGLYKGIKDSDGSVAGCFNPRHGIRATADGKTVDIVVCFECHSMMTYLGDMKGSALTARTPEASFNKVLTEAKVPLPPQREE